MTTLNPPQKRKWKLVDISAAAPTAKPSGAWGTRPPPKPSSTIVIKRFCAVNIPEIMDDWFYSRRQDDVSPHIFAVALAENFAKEVRQTDLEIVLSPNVFTKKICAAVTAYAHYDYFEHKQIGAPRGMQKAPKGWTKQTLNIWHDYLQSVYFHDGFFERFWRELPTAIWEEEYMHIRVYLQSILPYFIKYDESLLVDHSLIAVNSEGEYVDPADADVEEDESHPYE